MYIYFFISIFLISVIESLSSLSQGYFEALRTEKTGQRLDITLACVGPTESNLDNVCFTEKEGEVRGAL